MTDYEGWYPGVVEAVDVDDKGDVLYDVVYDNPEFEPEVELEAALVRRVSQAAPERPPWAEALAQLEKEWAETKKEDGVNAARALLADDPVAFFEMIVSHGRDADAHDLKMLVDNAEELADVLRDEQRHRMET